MDFPQAAYKPYHNFPLEKNARIEPGIEPGTLWSVGKDIILIEFWNVLVGRPADYKVVHEAD